MKLRSLFFFLLILVVACGGKVQVRAGLKDNTKKSASGDPLAGVPVGTGDAVRGADTAYVTVVTFYDLVTPPAVEIAVLTEKLREKYGSDVIRLAAKHQPSPEHPNSRLAATMGQGVLTLKGSDAFFRYRDDLGKLKEANPDTIRKTALASGITPAELDAGLASPAWSEKVEKDISLARALGIPEAPASLVNGILVAGVPTWEILVDTVEVELAKAKVLERSGKPRAAIYNEAVAANFADPKTRPNAANELEDPKTIWKVPVDKSPMRGKPNALVTLVMFSEFDCAYCKQASETMQRVRTEYGDKVRLVWKDQPEKDQHPRAMATANFARAARAQKGDAGFWAVHDKLFTAAKLEDPDLELIAKVTNIDGKAALAAVHNDTYRQDIDTDLNLADDVDAKGTPHFFVNGRRLIGSQPYEKFKVLLDEEVKKAEQIVRSGVDPMKLYDWIIKDGRTGAPVKRTVPPNTASPMRGPANAPVLVQEFCDFQSPECRRFEPKVEDLLKEFPNEVKVSWRDLPLPSHADAQLAHEAAHEALVQKRYEGFFKMHDKLFNNQSDMKRQDLETYAKEIGLDLPKFNRALDVHTHKWWMDSEVKVAADASITSVPTFAVGDYILMGPPSYAKLRKLVNRVLSEMPGGFQKPTGKKPVGPGPVGSPSKGGDPPLATGSKFQVIDLVVGNGRAAKTGDTVTITYRGKLTNGSEFDSSRSPYSFQLGSGMSIKGMEMGLPGMKVGGKRRIVIPPDMAFGNHGSGASIPANATVVFDVDLLKVE